MGTLILVLKRTEGRYGAIRRYPSGGNVDSTSALQLCNTPRSVRQLADVPARMVVG